MAFRSVMGDGLKKKKKDKKSKHELDGNGLGPLCSALGFWQTIPEKLHHGVGREGVAYIQYTRRGHSRSAWSHTAGPKPDHACIVLVRSWHAPPTHRAVGAALSTRLTFPG